MLFTSFVQLFQELEETYNLEEKLDIIGFFPHQKYLKIIFKVVYDPLITFGSVANDVVRLWQEGEIIVRKKASGKNKRFRNTIKILENFSKSRIQRNEISSLLKQQLKRVTKNEIVILRRIFQKDLKIGLNLDIVNKIYPGLIKPPTKFMYPEIYFPDLVLSFPILVEPRFKSVKRVKLTADVSGVVGAYTESHKNLSGLFEKVLDILLTLAKKIKGTIEIDSCLLYSTFKVKHKIEESNCLLDSDIGLLEKDLCLYLFDFVIDREKTTLTERRKNVKKFVGLLRRKNVSIPVKVMPGIVVTDKPAIFNSYKKSISKGYPGIYIKDLKSPYVYKRSTYWLRYDNIETKQGKIIDVIEGQRIFSGSCGCVVIQVQGKKISLTNLTPVQRKSLWDLRDSVKGKECTLEYQEGISNSTKLMNSAWGLV